MIYRFTEVLNDLVNYFLLGDILLLEDWKQANHLSDDLAMEFTTNESGDRIFAEGIVIPMTGIENYPYTILFNLSGDRPELCKERNRLQLRKSGYSLKVDHNTYDDAVIRQILQCVIVESKEKIKVVFIGGMEVETEVEQ